jgi:2-methylcitrate dehydratase PrpD
MSTLRNFAAQLHDVEFADLRERVKEVARQRVFDTLCAAVIGMHTADGKFLCRLGAKLASLDRGENALALTSLLVGAARSTEIDDIDIRSCTTVGSVVVPTAVCLAESDLGIDEERLLTAVVSGYEAMIRLGRAIKGATLLYEGVWPTQVTAAFAAAATTAKLLALDAPRTENALALALAMSNKLARTQLTVPGYRYFALGAAAVDGVQVAFAAAEGLGGADDALERFGKAIGADIDKTELDGPAEAILDVDTKLLPSSRQAIAGIEAFTTLLPLPEPIEEIREIRAAVPAPYRDMVDQPTVPGKRIASMLGMQYAMALAAIDSPSFFDAVRDTPPVAPEIETLMSKVVVESDAALGRRFPAIWGARVVVEFGSGRKLAVEVLEPQGSAARPPTWEDLGRKFARIFAASLIDSKDAGGNLLASCRELAARRPTAARSPGRGRIIEELDALYGRSVLCTNGRQGSKP